LIRVHSRPPLSRRAQLENQIVQRDGFLNVAAQQIGQIVDFPGGRANPMELEFSG
jgi:hypothetical protein